MRKVSSFSVASLLANDHHKSSSDLPKCPSPVSPPLPPPAHHHQRVSSQLTIGSGLHHHNNSHHDDDDLSVNSDSDVSDRNSSPPLAITSLPSSFGEMPTDAKGRLINTIGGLPRDLPSHINGLCRPPMPNTYPWLLKLNTNSGLFINQIPSVDLSRKFSFLNVFKCA